MNKKKLVCYILGGLFVIGMISFSIYCYNTMDKEGTNNKKVSSSFINKLYDKEFEEEWESLGESQKYFELGSEHLYYDEEQCEYKYSDNFVLALFKLCDGFYKEARTEDMIFIFDMLLGEFIDKAESKEVCFEFYNFAQHKDNKVYIEGLGKPLIYLEYLAESYGYKEGDTLVKNDKTYTYMGQDKWEDADGSKYKSKQNGDDLILELTESVVASNDKSNSNTNNNNTSSSSNKNNNSNSKYVSERWGYSKGDKANTTDGATYTYLGNDIWQDSSGNTYKARLEGNNIVFYEKSPFGVSSSTDDDGYMLPGTDTPEEDPDKNSSDPSGYETGTAGWHEYWDGKTYKEYKEQGGFRSLYYVIKEGEGNRLPTTKYYPDDYVIGSYGILEENFYGEGQHLYGKY